MDRWELRPAVNPNYLVRIHNVQRRTLFCPTSTSDPPPIDMQYFDVTRKTVTNGDENEDGRRTEIKDCWIGSKEHDEKPTKLDWCGETHFDILHPPAPKGYYWGDHRLTKKTTRSNKPESVHSDLWYSLQAKDKAK